MIANTSPDMLHVFSSEICSTYWYMGTANRPWGGGLTGECNVRIWENICRYFSSDWYDTQQHDFTYRWFCRKIWMKLKSYLSIANMSPALNVFFQGRPVWHYMMGCLLPNFSVSCEAVKIKLPPSICPASDMGCSNLQSNTRYGGPDMLCYR